MQSGQELLKLTQSTQEKALQALSQDLIASVWLAQEDYPQALAMYQTALANGGDSLRSYEAEGCARAFAGLGRFKEAEVMLPMMKKRESVSEIRGEMLLMQLKYSAAAVEVESAMTEKNKADWPPNMLLLAAVADAHLRKSADAQADLAAFKAVTPPDRARLDLASAEVTQQAGNLEESRHHAQAALAYFRSAGARDSALHATVLAEDSTSGAPGQNNSSDTANFRLDTLRQIQQSWAAADYASFTARPDIASWLPHPRKGNR